MILVEWECNDCGHIWFEDSDASDYPGYCPCCLALEGEERIKKTGKTFPIEEGM
jgi:hypothetical protein